MHVLDLDTPAIAVDRPRMMANLRRAQAHADRLGVALRPHIKTHKVPAFARLQVAIGAKGITCQKIGEAEVMADAGLDDILLPYNILGRAKLDRLKALHGRIAVAVGADSAETIDGYAERFTDAGHELPVLVECDTGGGRCGATTPARMLHLARLIDAAPGLRFAGIMTYPPRDRIAAVDAWLAESKALAFASGLALERISNGGSPDFYGLAPGLTATEHRPGTYIYGDRMQASFGHATLEDCAFTVVATVVSRPTADRVVLDAGSKALAADLCAARGHGHIVEYPLAVIGSLSEEHAVADFSAEASRPAIGEHVRVIPNHVCPVSNLFDELNVVEDGILVGTLPIAARGRSS